jgi:cyanophycinase
VLLSGGGDPEALGPVVERLVTEVRRGTAAAPTIGVLPGGSRELIDAVTRLGSAAGVTVTELPTAPATSDVLPLNALVVGDGDAAQLLMALGEVVSDVRGLVHRGASYLGIGAGAAIAADTVLLGGSEIGGVAVGPAATDAETEVEAAAGLGLIDLTVVPAAATSGRVGLGVAAIEAELTDRILGLDLDTTLVIGEGELELLGRGSMWELSAGDDGVTVRTSRASTE